MSREYYGVITRFFDSGKVTVKRFTVQAEAWPENKFQSLRQYDEYTDYFETPELAANWADQARRA